MFFGYFRISLKTVRESMNFRPTNLAVCGFGSVIYPYMLHVDNFYHTIKICKATIINNLKLNEKALPIPFVV